MVEGGGRRRTARHEAATIDAGGGRGRAASPGGQACAWEDGRPRRAGTRVGADMNRAAGAVGGRPPRPPRRRRGGRRRADPASRWACGHDGIGPPPLRGRKCVRGRSRDLPGGEEPFRERLRRRGHPEPSRQAPVAQLDRAPDYESGGQEFESLRARHLPSRFQKPSPNGCADLRKSWPDFSPCP